MTFNLPVAVQTMLELAAALGALTIIAYILKLRRRRFEVPFSKLWQRVLREKETTSLWRKLRRLLSLVVQLAFLALLLGAALDPRLGEARSSGKHVVVILDASASMKTLDKGPAKPARIERAKDEARTLLASLGGADVAMIIKMDGQATALTRFDSDSPRLVKVIDRVTASDTPADLHRALQAAADALRGRKDPMIVIIGDGAYPDLDEGVAWQGEPDRLGVVDLRGIDVRWLPVGQEARNVGITAFNVRRYLANKLSFEVLVELQNFGFAKETVKLTLYAGDSPFDVKTLTLEPGEARREIYPDRGSEEGDRTLRAHVEPVGGPDAFALDDTAFALLPERHKQKVLLVSNDNLYLEGALLLDPNIQVDKLKPEEYAKEAATLPVYDVVLFDGYTPDAPPPSRGAMYFNPSGDKSPFAIKRDLPRPFITDVEQDHPVTRWVSLSDVNIDRSSVFAPAAGDVVLARSIRDPIVMAGKRGGRKLVAFGFGLDGTDLTLRVAFPVMIVNALDWFAGDDAELITTYRTGHTWAIPVDAGESLGQVTVRGPDGQSAAPVTGGRARFYGRQVGVYQIQAGAQLVMVAANLADPAESAVRPRPELVIGGRKLEAPPAFVPSVSRAVWMWFALGALLLSLVEWGTYHRRITV